MLLDLINTMTTELWIKFNSLCKELQLNKDFRHQKKGWTIKNIRLRKDLAVDLSSKNSLFIHRTNFRLMIFKMMRQKLIMMIA